MVGLSLFLGLKSPLLVKCIGRASVSHMCVKCKQNERGSDYNTESLIMDHCWCHTWKVLCSWNVSFRIFQTESIRFYPSFQPEIRKPNNFKKKLILLNLFSSYISMKYCWKYMPLDINSLNSICHSKLIYYYRPKNGLSLFNLNTSNIVR